MGKYVQINEFIIDYFKVILNNLSGLTEEKLHKLGISYIQANAWTLVLPNTKYGC